MDSGMKQSLRQNDDGSALVEGAIVVPVLFALVFGVFEFSWLFYQQHLISTGIRDAARYIARSASPTDPTIQMDARNLAATGTFAGGVARGRGWSARDVQISFASVAHSPGSTV